MRCLILLHPFIQSLYIPLEFYRHVDKINMVHFLYFMAFIDAQAMKCRVTHLSSLLVYAVFTILSMQYTERAIEGADNS